MPTTTAPPRCHKCNRRGKNISRCGGTHYCPTHRREWIEKLRLGTHEAAVRRKAAGARYCEPTMEQLDELIAKQMKRLPKWWTRESSTDESQRPLLKLKGQ